MKKIILLALCLVLSGCSSSLSPAPVKDTNKVTSIQKSASSAQQQNSPVPAILQQNNDTIPSIDEPPVITKTISGDILNQAPIPYSVEALGSLDFVGSGLVLEETLTVNAAYTRYRISYMSNGKKISGVMNIPVGSGPFPLVILNHGYIDPAVYTVGRGLKREQDYLARAGYAILHTDYRGHGLGDSDEEMENNYIFRNYFYTQDSINAILAVQNSSLPETTSIDTESVGMLGHSMGGGVTMHALIAKPGLIDAAVLYAPVHSSERYNFDRRRANDLSAVQKREREDRIGALTIENLMPYSVTPFAERISAPVQIYFGTNDASVPYQRGVDIQTIFQKAGVTSELITYTGEKHEFIPQWNAFMQSVVIFFDEQL